METKLAVNLSQKAEENVEYVKQKLSKRGVKKSQVPGLVNLLLEVVSRKILDEYIDKNTPLKWKAEQLLKSKSGCLEISKAYKSIKQSENKFSGTGSKDV